MKPMKIHPLCKLFPRMDGAEIKSLAADIKANGLRHPIITLHGEILDGRNRYTACLLAKVEPRFEEYHVDRQGYSEVAFVVSQNLARRHLTDDQRAAIAAELANAKHGGDRGQEDNSSYPKSGTTIAQAAKVFKVNPKQVSRAKRVRNESPRAFKKVKEGKLSLNAAHEQKHPRKPLARGGLCADAIRAKRGEIERLTITAVCGSFVRADDSQVSPAEFQKALDLLEARIPEDGNHEKFGVILNKAANRQMNWGIKRSVFAYGR